MKIGIDVDNVIANFDDCLLEEYLKHDKTLRNTGIVNYNPLYLRKGMFDWSIEEERNFYQSNIERIVKTLRPLKDASFYIQRLKELGHTIYIITGRDNGEYSDPYHMTEKWLEQNHIPYDKLLLTNANQKHEKATICLKHHIDLMIEDSLKTCEALQESSVTVYTMNTRYNQRNDEFIRVSNWKEIYEKITSITRETCVAKKNVILDTDTYNECDDQFALSYLLKSQYLFQIDAITIAPYHHDHQISIEEGINKSYDEVLKICDLLQFNTENKVFKGSCNYVQNGYDEMTEAVEKIIEISTRNEFTTILAIGAITNVALAISKCPTIVDKIEVIWLGGHSLLSNNNNEFNFYQDVEGLKKVFASNVKLTIIPCKNVASNLLTSIFELEHYLKNKSELGNYLCQRFLNDGIHGIQERRVLWDISVVAYVINSDWFEQEQISCPNIKEDMSYELTESNHKITMVNYLNAKAIFYDLMRRISEI